MSLGWVRTPGLAREQSPVPSFEDRARVGAGAGHGFFGARRTSGADGQGLDWAKARAWDECVPWRGESPLSGEDWMR
jgi:hypothetical protein